MNRVLAQRAFIALIWLAMLGCSRPSDGAHPDFDQAQPHTTGQQMAGQQPRVPALPPDSVPRALWDKLHAPENMIRSSPEWGVPFPRNLIVLAFKEDATQSERQQAVDAVGGEVIGGEHVDRGGYYYVRIRSDGTGEALFRAITKLKTFPKVDLASPEPLPVGPSAARP